MERKLLIGSEVPHMAKEIYSPLCVFTDVFKAADGQSGHPCVSMAVPDWYLIDRINIYM